MSNIYIRPIRGLRGYVIQISHFKCDMLLEHVWCSPASHSLISCTFVPKSLMRMRISKWAITSRHVSYASPLPNLDFRLHVHLNPSARVGFKPVGVHTAHCATTCQAVFACIQCACALISLAPHRIVLHGSFSLAPAIHMVTTIKRRSFLRRNKVLCMA